MCTLKFSRKLNICRILSQFSVNLHSEISAFAKPQTPPLAINKVDEMHISTNHVLSAIPQSWELVSERGHKGKKLFIFDNSSTLIWYFPISNNSLPHKLSEWWFRRELFGRKWLDNLFWLFIPVKIFSKEEKIIFSVCLGLFTIRSWQGSLFIVGLVG